MKQTTLEQKAAHLDEMLNEKYPYVYAGVEYAKCFIKERGVDVMNNPNVVDCYYDYLLSNNLCEVDE